MIFFFFSFVSGRNPSLSCDLIGYSSGRNFTISWPKLTSTEFVSSQKSTSQSPKSDENKQIRFIYSDIFGELLDVNMYISAMF